MERSLMIKQMKPNNVMEYLGINSKFFLKKSGTNFLKKAFSSHSVDHGVETEESDLGDSKARGSTSERSSVPYIEAIREIEKIQDL